MGKSNAVDALRRLADVIADAIAAAPSGISSGRVYIMMQALAGERYTLQAHETIVAYLVTAGRLTSEGHWLREKR